MSNPQYQLSALMPQGFRSGLRWETKGAVIPPPPPTTSSRKNNKQPTLHQRDLLSFPGSAQLAKAIVKDLGSTNPVFVSGVLAEFFRSARRCCEQAQDMRPVDFFGGAFVMGTQRWTMCSDKDKDKKNKKDKGDKDKGENESVSKELFWRLMYRVMHARALFLDTYYGYYYDRANGSGRAATSSLPTTSLTEAVDAFRDTFFAYYDPNNPPDRIKHSSKYTRDRYARQCMDMRAEYFGFSGADSEGDGTDRLVVQPTTHNRRTMREQEKKKKEEEQEEKEEQMIIGFFYDEGPNTPAYGHTDLSLPI